MDEQRLIDATEFDKILKEAEVEAQKHRKYVYASAINSVRGNLKNAKTVEGHKKGMWIRWLEVIESESCTDYIPHYKCSECGTEYNPHSINFVNFCHVCGADMREKKWVNRD